MNRTLVVSGGLREEKASRNANDEGLVENADLDDGNAVGVCVHHNVVGPGEHR